MRRTVKTAIVVLVGIGAVVLLGSAIGQWVPEDTADAGQPLLSRGAERVTVDVLNAGGVPGMARTATDHLRGAGFDVVSVGNAASFDQDSTVVIDRIGNLPKAAAVAAALGVRSVTSEPDSNLFVDVTVRLGAEWSAPETGVDESPGGVLEWLRRVAGRQQEEEERSPDG